MISLVKVIRVARKNGRDIRIDSRDEPLLKERVVASVWYPIDHFQRLADVVANQLLGGGDDAAITLGRAGVEVDLIDGVYRAFLREDPWRTAKALPQLMELYHDFCKAHVQLQPPRVVMRVLHYPHITRTNGLMVLGWAAGMLQASGGKVLDAAVTAWPDEDTSHFEAYWELDVTRSPYAEL